jgi:hypothetical protein
MRLQNLGPSPRRSRRGRRRFVEFGFSVSLPVVLAIAPSASAGSLAVTEAAKYNGVYGLEVTVGSSCVADEDAVLPAQTVSGLATFEGCNSITAGAGGFTVTGTGGATFTAGNWIALESGFSVLSGGVFTAEIDAALTPFAWVQDDSPVSETSYNAQFWVNLDLFSLGGGDELDHFVAYGGGSAPELVLVITTGKALVLEVRTDAGTYTSTSSVATSAGWNKVDISWTAASGATVSLTVNDGAPAQVVANTSTRRINSVRWGAVGGVVTTSSGTILQDDFTSWR